MFFINFGPEAKGSQKSELIITTQAKIPIHRRQDVRGKPHTNVPGNTHGHDGCSQVGTKTKPNPAVPLAGFEPGS